MTQYQVTVDEATVAQVLQRDDGLAEFVRVVLNQLLDAQSPNDCSLTTMSAPRTARAIAMGREHGAVEERRMSLNRGPSFHGTFWT